MALNGVDIKNNIIYENGHAGIGCYAATGSGVVAVRRRSTIRIRRSCCKSMAFPPNFPAAPQQTFVLGTFSFGDNSSDHGIGTPTSAPKPK